MARKPRKEQKAERPTRLINQHQAPSIYANFAHMGMTPFEITVRFNEILKADEDELLLRELAYVIMAPPFAKAVHDLLGRTLAKYQEEYGVVAQKHIEIPKD